MQYHINTAHILKQTIEFFKVKCIGKADWLPVQFISFLIGFSTTLWM